jgi:two-component system, OmpR family, response regulator
MRILIIEDDETAAGYLIRALKEAGHVCDLYANGDDGLAAARADDFDVMIIDRMLPGRDGISIIETLRREGVKTPVLVLSALGGVDDRVTGLRAGGDDYLTKPYAMSELLARVEALARRPAPEEAETRYVVADLVLDRLAHKVTRSGDAIVLQPREIGRAHV